MPTSHTVLFVFYTAAAALYIAGAATAWLVTDDGTTNTKYTFWQTCATPSSMSSGTPTCTAIATSQCSALQQVINAGQSWGIITCVLGGFAAVIALVRLFMEDIVSTGVMRWVYVILVLLSVIAAALQWIIAFAAYGYTFCGTKLRDSPTSTAGPQGPLFFVGFVIAFLAWFLELCYGGAPAAAATTTTKTDNAPTDDKTAADAPIAATVVVTTDGASATVTVNA
jgi:hypothetical protein